MSSARPHPPSAQRIAEARANGHLPRTPLVGFVCGLFALLGMARWCAEQCSAALRVLLQRPLLLAARGDTRAAYAQLWAPVRELGAALALSLLACVVATIAGQWLAQGPRGIARSRRFAPPRLREDFTARAVWCLGLVGLIALSSFAWPELSELSSVAATFALRLLLLSLGCALIEAAFARAAFYRSLWLSRREHLLEQREAYGAPEMRAARSERGRS